MQLLSPVPIVIQRPSATPRPRSRGAVRTYQNPLLRQDCPDPGVLRVGGAYYLVYTSGNARDAFPTLRSTDLVLWQRVGSAFPTGHRPTWARSDFWAPEIHRLGRRFVLYYTARDRTGRLCVGAAWSKAPVGPWTELGHPLLRDERVGMIDATQFTDRDGRRYLYWKEDSNDLRPKEPTRLFVQELARDGLSLVGSRREVLRNDREWEGDLVEGPSMLRHGRYYYLIYSGNAFYNENYAVGVARSTSLWGPFVKADQTLLRRDEDWLGPGHGSAVRGPDGHDYFIYHAWQRGRVGGRNPRMLLMDRIEWKDGWPTIHDGSPSNTPQPAP
jgi:arabinan endo-1,5-alpha-L-arabinosidase